MTRRHGLFIASVVSAGLLLGYLRDPPWLAGVESGLMSWQTDADGTRFRWTNGHASFFVPSSFSRIRLSLRAAPPGSGVSPGLVTITVDDRVRTRIATSTAGWQQLVVDLGRDSRRHLRRIDIHVDRVLPMNRGVQLGEVRLE